MSGLEDVQNLIDWGVREGVYLNPKLEIPAIFDQGCVGVRAKEIISPSEILITIPNRGLLSTKIISPPELQDIYDSHPELFSSNSKEHEDFKLITYMIYELAKHENSIWHVYFQSLPKTIDNLLDWTAEDLDELQDADLKYDICIRAQKDALCNRELHDVLVQYHEIFNVDNASVSKITWAWRAIVTRAFGKFLPYSALVPIGDLLNHDSCKTNYYYAKISDLPPDYYPEGKESEDEDDDEEMYESPVSINLSSQKLYKLNFGVYSHSDEDFLEISKQIALQAKKNDAKLFINKLKVADKLSTVTTVEESNEKFFIISAAKDKGFEAGEQVCIPYGRYSNRILLTNYGFAMTKNKYNYARIKISLKDLLTESQREKLTQNYDPDMRIAFKIKSSFLNTDLLEIIRGLLWNYHQHTAESFFTPVNLELEMICLSKMRSILINIVARFPTSIDQDKLMLESTRNSRQYFAIIYRISVKENLVDQILLIDLAMKNIEQLRNKESNADATRPVTISEITTESLPSDTPAHRKAIKEYINLVILSLN